MTLTFPPPDAGADSRGPRVEVDIEVVALAVASGSLAALDAAVGLVRGELCASFHVGRGIRAG